MQHSRNPKQGGLADNWFSNLTMSIGDNNNKTMAKRPGKRPGRKPSKIDERAKLERSRQSARECRARKKLRYQYLEELVSNREKAVFALRDELELYKQWSIQLENGGPVPEALLKKIASEDVAIKRRQMAQVAQSLLRQQQNFQFSSSSSSSTSPELGSSQRQQQRQISVVQPQTVVNEALHKSQIHQPVPDHLSSQCQQQLQLQQLLQHKHSAGPALLQRQFAFDHYKHQERQPNEMTPNLQTVPPTIETAPNSNTLPSSSLSHEQMQGVVFQPGISQQQQHSFLQLNHHQQQPNTTLPSHSAYSPYLPENTLRAAMTSKSQELLLPRVNSEQQMKHGHSFDLSRIYADTRADNYILSSDSEINRKRTNSNPLTMASFVHPNVNITSPDDLPSPLQDFITSHSSSCQTANQPSLGFGLFSGSLVSNRPISSSFNIPTTITVEDSSCSDDSINEQHLFQSSMTSQKRKVAAPFLPESAKRSLAAANGMPSTPAITNFDPNSGLLNLENLHCFGVTTASSTPSPSSYGHTSSSAPSPSYSPRYSGLSNSTPLSCATASPAPLSSLSSILELSVSSPGISSSTQSSALEISPSVASAQTNLSTDSATSYYTAPAMSTFLHDWYSFLADLDDRTTSSLTSQQGTSSSVSMTFNPNQHPQSFTPNQSFMNVPDIINEMLTSDSELL